MEAISMHEPVKNSLSALRRCWPALLGTMFSLIASLCAQAEVWHEEQGFRYRELTVPAQGHAGFVRLNPADLGITFTNLLTPEHDMNNQNLINESGVALGAVDADGWCDIFLCILDAPNKLYRNLC